MSYRLYANDDNYFEQIRIKNILIIFGFPKIQGW